MSPSVANVVVQIAAVEAASNGTPVSVERVRDRLQRLGFDSEAIDSALSVAEELGIVQKSARGDLSIARPVHERAAAGV